MFVFWWNAIGEYLEPLSTYLLQKLFYNVFVQRIIIKRELQIPPPSKKKKMPKTKIKPRNPFYLKGRYSQKENLKCVLQNLFLKNNCIRNAKIYTKAVFIVTFLNSDNCERYQYWIPERCLNFNKKTCSTEGTHFNF